MRRDLFTVLALISLTFVVHGRVLADEPDGDVWGDISDGTDEIVLTGDDAQDAGSNVIPAASGRVTVETAWTPACSQNYPGIRDESCPAAISLCSAPGPGEIPSMMMWRWIRQWDRVAATAITDWQIAETVCLDPDTAAVPNISLLILQAFQERVKLLEAAVQIQPSSGRTLVNLDTIFYTDDPSTTVTGIDILGRSVDLRITATVFHWYFGDGSSATTATGGRPYPSKDITHQYASTGAVAPRVDVTYVGEYRIDGGGWLDIPGEATVTGPTVPLTVVEARSQLVAG